MTYGSETNCVKCISLVLIDGTRRTIFNSYDISVIGWVRLACYVSVSLSLSLQNETLWGHSLWFAGHETQPILKGESFTKGLQTNILALASVTLLFEAMAFNVKKYMDLLWSVNLKIYFFCPCPLIFGVATNTQNLFCQSRCSSREV